VEQTVKTVFLWSTRDTHSPLTEAEGLNIGISQVRSGAAPWSAVEESLYESVSLRGFADIDLGPEPVPDGGCRLQSNPPEEAGDSSGVR
jgi:hypothetical protein